MCFPRCFSYGSLAVLDAMPASTSSCQNFCCISSFACIELRWLRSSAVAYWDAKQSRLCDTMHLGVVPRRNGCNKQVKSVWRSYTLRRRRATSVLLYVFNHTIDCEWYFVVVTSLVPEKAHRAAKSFDTNWGALSFRTVLEILFGTVQCLRKVFETVGVAILVVRIALLSLLYQPAIRIGKWFSCPVSVKEPSVLVATNLESSLGENRCISPHYLWERQWLLQKRLFSTNL